MKTDERGGAAQVNQELCTEIEKSVLAFCGRAGLFPPAEEPFPGLRGETGASAVFGPGSDAPRHVVAAVSGGADSMALLRILLALAGPLRLTVTACHVNHGLRGAPADADEAFVRAQCASLGVPLAVFSARQDGRTIPENAGEDWARRLRYGYFSGFAAEGTARVATAHTLSDQAETLLFRLARGTGPHGAAGIAPARGLYVRPLLCLTRQETEAYCAAAGQAWVTDETNADDTFARNRLRHEAIPALTAANGAAVRNLGAFCEKMARVDAYFAAEAEKLLGEACETGAAPESGPWALAALRAAQPLVLRAALHRLTAAVRDPEEKYIALLESLVQSGSGAVQLRPDVRFLAAGELLRRESALPAAQTGSDAQPQDSAAPAVPLQTGIFRLPGGYCLKIETGGPFIAEKTQCVHKKDLKNIADYAKIGVLSVLRTRLPGDRFRPAGRGVEKSLKKLFNERHIPPAARARLPLIAEEGRVEWLWDEGFAEGLAPDADTKMWLRITQLEAVEDTGSWQ